MLKKLIIISSSAAVGTLIGMLFSKNDISKGAVKGALIGMTAGTLASYLNTICEDASILYYGKSSGLYEGADEDLII
ncbi:MAG: hypothetical protein N3A62_06310 [Thermodesulfovibrionales bacterium]|nr:hypothetical protein [Thermodesulfovibrionales bacterium]